MSDKGIEKRFMQVCTANINMTVPWYLMAAYAYYVDDNPILEDNTFDKLAKRIAAQWDTIEHRHKSYLTKDMLEAGTFLGDYPPHVEGAVSNVRATCATKRRKR